MKKVNKNITYSMYITDTLKNEETYLSGAKKVFYSLFLNSTYGEHVLHS